MDWFRPRAELHPLKAGITLGVVGNASVKTPAETLFLLPCEVVMWDRLSRRRFITSAAGAAGLLVTTGANGISAAQSAPAKKLRVAAINSIFRFRSHAYHI
ncbi:MAG: hypothetical protein WEH44_01810, partial [Pirellulaceae bacterium]